MNYREAWANGDIEAGTLVDRIEEQNEIIARYDTTAENCEVLRSRLAKYEDADGNPISTMAEKALEIASLRSIISECAAACGAVVSVHCSEGFMAMLPDEIRSVISGKSREIASKQATIDGMNEAHCKVAQELATLSAKP